MGADKYVEIEFDLGTIRKLNITEERISKKNDVVKNSRK
jgi:hypothetical protein